MPQTVSGWKDDPVFMEQYESVWTGDIRRTQEILARTRDEAALTLKDLLKTRDIRTRRAVAVDILDRTGLRPGESVTVDLSPALAGLLAAAGEAGSGVEGDGEAGMVAEGDGEGDE